MNPALAIFVKTPGLSPIKTRIAATLGEARALEIYDRLVLEVENLASTAKSQLSFSCYWAVAEERGMDNPRWKNFPKVSQGVGGLGDRLHKVYQELLTRHPQVFLVGADCPGIKISHLKEAVQKTKRGTFTLGKTVDGGFYLLGGSDPLSLDLWKSVPYSQNNTAAELEKKLLVLGKVSELETLRDMDTAEDLASWDI